MTDHQIVLRIRANDDGASQVLNSHTRQLRDMGSAADITSRAMRSLTLLAAGAFGGISAAKLLTDLYNVNKELNAVRNGLITATGSEAAANAEFQRLANYKIAPIVGVKELAQDFGRLKNLALEANESILTAYANIAAATPGKSITDVVEAVADAVTGEFERLKEFGVKASKEGDNVTFAFQGVETTVKNSADAIQDYLQKIGSVNFAGAVERQLTTIDGATKRFGNTWDAMLDKLISNEFEGKIVKVINHVSTLVEQFDKLLNGDNSTSGRVSNLNARIGQLQSDIEKYQGVDLWGARKDPAKLQAMQEELLGLVRNRDKLNETVTAYKALNEETQKNVAIQNQQNKALGDKFDLENRLKNLFDGQYKSKLIAEANRQGLDPNIALTVASLETNSGTGIKSSPKGAQGLLQIMPGTAQDLTKAVGLSVDQILHTIDGNIKAGVTYLKQQEIALAKQGKASLTGILASYNAGRGNFLDGDYLKFKETQDYVKHGKQIYDALSEAAGGVEKFTQAQAKGKEETFKAVTSQERLLAATLEAEDLRNRGLVSQAGYNQLLLDAQSAYDKLSEKTFNAITPGEQLSETLNKLKTQLGAGEISQAGFNQEQERAISAYQEAIGITDNFIKAKAAEEKQQKAVNDALKQYTDLQAINAGIQDQAQFADQLADVGFTTDQIKQQLDIYKQINEAVKQNPLLDPGQVQEMTFTRIQGELQIQEATRTSIDIVSQAWEQSVKNMQTSLSNGIKGVLIGDALNSFKAFADNLKNTLYDAVSNALSAGLIDGFKNNDWLSVGKSALMIGLSSLGGLLSKSSPTASAPSKALSAAAGTGAMSIADIQSRGAGYQFATESVKQYNQDIKNITNAGLSLTNQIMGDFGAKLVESIASKAGSWASSFAGAAKSLSTTAGNAIAGIGSIYTLFDYFSNLGKLLDSGNIVRIAGQTMVAAGAAVTGVMSAAAIAGSSMNPVGWVIGAVLAAVGGLMSLFSKDRIPNNWQNTFNPLQSAENPNRSSAAFDRNAIKNVYIDGKVVPVGADGTYYSTGNKSATAGVVTEFGATQFSSHEMKQSIDSIKNQFGGLLGIIREFDGTLSKAVGSGAMQFYSKWLGDAADNTIKFKQNAKDLDTGAMLFDRYDRIINKLAESGDAKAQTVNVWFDALMSKFSKTDANFEQLVLSVVGGISNNIEQFAQMPASLAKLVVDSVKGTSAGASVKEVLSEASKVISVYQAVNAGLSAMGASANQDAVVGFLASMNKISYSVQDAGSNLLAYADVLRIMGQNVDVAVAAQAKLNALQQSGASNDLITAYFSSAGVIAQKLQAMGASFTDANLDATALHISNLAKASQETARNVVDHAIASENLGDKSRESAIAILLSSKKLDEQTVKISEYSGAVAEFTQQQIDGLNFVQSILDGTGASFESLGIKTGDLVGVSDTLIKQYGSVAAAMEKHIGLMKIAFGEEAVKSFGNNQAFTEQQRILARNPDFAQYGLYAGMNSENLQAANVAASNALGKPLNEIVAAVNAFLPLSPDLRRFLELAGAFDNKTASGEVSPGYKPNYTFTPSKTPITIETVITPEAVNKIEDLTLKLSDFMQPFKDSAATRGMSDYEKELFNLQKGYEQNLVEAQKLGAGYDDLALITSDYTAKVADAAKAQAKAIATIISSAAKDISRLSNTDFESTLYGISDGFLSQMAELIKSGGKFADVATLYSYAVQAGATATQKAVKQIQDDFKAVYDTISTKRNAIADDLTRMVYQDPKIADEQVALGQFQRAIVQLNSGIFEQQMTAIDTLHSLTMANYNKQAEAIGKLKDASKGVADYIQGFKVGNLSTLSPEAMLAETRAQYQTQLAAAQAGDPEAYGKATSAFDRYAQSLRDYYGSGEATQTAIAQGLADLGGLAQPSGTNYQQQLVDLSTQTKDSLLTLVNSTFDIETQRKTAEAQQIAAINASAAAIKQGFADSVQALEGFAQLLATQTQNVKLKVALEGTLTEPQMNMITALYTGKPQETFNALVGMTRTGELATDRGLQIFDRFFAANPATTFTSTLTAYRAGLLSDAQGQALFDRMFGANPAATFSSTLTAFKSGLLSDTQGQLLFDRMFGSNPNATFSSTLAAVRSGELGTDAGLTLFNRMFSNNPAATFSSTLTAFKSGLLSSAEGQLLFDRMFGLNPNPTFSSTLSAVRSGELGTDAGLLLFNRMFGANPSATFSSTLTAFKSGLLSDTQGQLLFDRMFGSNPNATFSSTLAAVRSGELGTDAGLTLFNRMFSNNPAATFSSTLTAFKSGLLSSAEGQLLFDRMFGLNPNPTFSSTLSAVRSGELGTDAGLLLFNRMFGANPSATFSSTLTAFKSGLLSSAEGQLLFDRMFGLNPNPTFSSTLSAVRSGELGTDAGLLLFNRMFGANPNATVSATIAAYRTGELNSVDGLSLFNRMYSADPGTTKTATLNAVAAGLLTDAEGKAIFNALGVSTIVTKTANVNAVLTGNSTAADIAKSGLTNTSSTVTVTSTLTLDAVLNNSILSYSKADVATVYNLIASNTGATKSSVDSVVANVVGTNSALASIANILTTIMHNGINVDLQTYAIKQALLGTLTVQSSYRTGPLMTFASGGKYPGGMALVGEQGPELINFNSPGWISTAAQTQQIIADLQANARQSFNAPNASNPVFAPIVVDNKAQNEELKKQTKLLEERNARLEQELAIQREGFNKMIEQLKKSNDKLDNMESELRKAAA